MNTDVLSTDGSSKRRRIMIITDDENVINQLQISNSTSVLKSIVFESKIDDLDISSQAFFDQEYFPEEKQPTSSVDLQKKRRNHSASLTCVVCGASAFGYNFDAITCESCKAFFRRNALKDPETLECRRKRTCDITLTTRRRCTACRLTKCFKNGMRRERLMTEEQREEKRRKIEANRNLTSHSHDESSEQSQSSLSSVRACLKRMPPKGGAKKRSVGSEPAQINSPTDSDILFHTDFTDLLPPTLAIEESRALLSVEELKRLENIQLSYQQRIELAARDGLPWNPTFHATTLLQHINGRSVTAMRLLSFFKQIPEFDQLEIGDKVTLIKYNLMPLTCLNSSLFYRIDTEQVIETDSDEPWSTKTFQKFHGIDLAKKVKKIFELFFHIAQYDQRIIQLSLIVLMLTKGFSTLDGAFEPALNNRMAVYRAQSYYTELLWKYMESQHGSDQAVRIFSALVAHFVSWQALHREMHTNLKRILTAADIDDMLPIMKSLLLFS